MKAKDFTGTRFGRLLAVERLAPNGSQRRAHYRCLCDCGNVHVVCGSSLVTKSTKSCGCLAKEKLAEVAKTWTLRHGQCGTPTYRTWKSMVARCTRTTHHAYARYGGRGIVVCDSWRDFTNFLADMGPRPTETTLDRIDGDGPYSPENCRWATWIEQQQNRRSNVILEHLGKSQCVAAWAREYGIAADTFTWRIKHGWSMEDALAAPAKRRPEAKSAIEYLDDCHDVLTEGV